MEILPDFISPLRVMQLQSIAFSVTQGWRFGRQGTGYEILPLRGPGELPLVGSQVPAGDARLTVLAHITKALSVLGQPKDERWDAYFVRHPRGSYVPRHVDPAALGLRHRRLNVLLASSTSGGDFIVDNRTIEWSEGDAVCFFPDNDPHEVTRVWGTPRLLLSVGAWL